MKLEIELKEDIKAWRYKGGKVAVRFDGATDIFGDDTEAELAIAEYLSNSCSEVIAAAAAEIIILHHCEYRHEDAPQN